MNVDTPAIISTPLVTVGTLITTEDNYVLFSYHPMATDFIVNFIFAATPIQLIKFRNESH